MQSSKSNKSRLRQYKRALSKTEGLIPKLRFPEFEKDGEWNEDDLGQLATFFNGKGLAKSDIIDNGKYLCIHYGELFTKYSEVINEIDSLTNLEDGFYSIANDVLMPNSDVTPRGLAKASCIKINDVFLGGGILVIRTDTSEFDGEFLSRLIRHREREVLKYVTGITVYHLYASSIKKLTIHYPNLDEQQKIASCLSSLDELIAAHKDKLEALKDHKKGLMQNLFPHPSTSSGSGRSGSANITDGSEDYTVGLKNTTTAEGIEALEMPEARVPKYRFPEFEKDGEWVEKILENVIDSESSSLALNKIKLKKIGYPVYGADRIVGYIDEFQQEEKYISVVKDGAGIGRLKLCQPKSSILGTLLCIKSKKLKKYHLDWIYYQMNTINFTSYKKGSGIPHIYFSDFKTESIRVPNPKEQQKIAACLSAVDESITAQVEKIEHLQQHKKGLMQGLFPKIEG